MSDSSARVLGVVALVGLAALLVSHVGLRSEVAELRGRIAAMREPAAVQATAVQASPVPKVVAAPAPVRPNKWVCKGTLDADHVGLRIAAHAPAVLGCIQAITKDFPTLSGRLQVLAKVNAAGKISEANVSGIDNEKLIECVGNEALTWTFDPPRGGDCAIVSAPFKVGR